MSESETSSQQPEFSEVHLLEEYRANIELWKHDDMLRQERDKKFLTINTILVVALGAFLQLGSNNQSFFGNPALDSSIAVIVLALTGFIACLVWHFVLARNAEYVRFRRFQLRAIEKELQNHKTFERMHRALDNEEDILYPTLGETFVVKKSRGMLSSTVTEGRVPSLAAFFWLLILILGIILFISAIK